MGCKSCKSADMRRRETSPFNESTRYRRVRMPPHHDDAAAMSSERRQRSASDIDQGNDEGGDNDDDDVEHYAVPVDGCGDGTLFPATAHLKVINRAQAQHHPTPSRVQRQFPIQEHQLPHYANDHHQHRHPYPEEIPSEITPVRDFDSATRATQYHSPSPHQQQPTPPPQQQMSWQPVRRPHTPRGRTGATPTRGNGIRHATDTDTEDDDGELVMVCTHCLMEITDDRTPQVCRVTGRDHY